MSEFRKNIELNNGWILCPSKSFPGKFYYFNVLNGEAAWSLNQADNKGVKKESSFHKIADKSHEYPEPSTLPDETTITAHNIFPNNRIPGFLQNNTSTHQLPTFGQVTFPKYVTNIEPLIPNIVWTSVPFPMFCPEIKKPMFDKVTQVSEFERDLFSQSSNIPLCKRFKNYEKPILSFDRKNKIGKSKATFEASTPRNPFLECASEPQKIFSKLLVKEPILKFEPKLPSEKNPVVIKSNEKPIITFSNKVESTTTEALKVDEKESVLENLDSTDLRFILLAKRKSVDTKDSAVERKKTKPSEIKPLTLKKKVTFDLKDATDEETDNDTNEGDTQDGFIPLATNQTFSTLDTPKSPLFLEDKIPPSFIKDTSKEPPRHDQLPIYQPTANCQKPTFKTKTWYIVVDTDVLLLDYEMIDQIVLSDPKCRLVIPHAVAKDIEALCLGDCRGQQRVINARQLTRRLAAPPPHYIVEPRTSDHGNMFVTTDSILHCCMKAVNKNYYVVLITNDPHLKIRATFLNIKSYKLNEIKYGVDIKPNNTSEINNVQIKSTSADSNGQNQLNHSLNLLSNLKIKSDVISKGKMTSRDDIDKNNLYDQNGRLFSFKTPVQKQLFLSSDSETDNSVDSDKLINITRPKCMNNIENMTKSDSDGTSDISSEVLNLNLKKGKKVLKPKNAGRNPFLPQTVKENGFVNFEKRIINSNFVSNTINFKKTIPNEKVVIKPNYEQDSLEHNFGNTEKLFCSTPITIEKQYESFPNLENSGKPKTAKIFSTLPAEQFGTNIENKILNPSQSRIKKMITTINNDPATKPQLENQNTKTKDSTGIFKIPQLLPIKTGTRNTSVHVEKSTLNDKIGTRTNIDSIDENIMRFQIKSRIMRGKLRTRIDEWICSYMQIMEDALFNILQNNSVCMENTVAPLTLKDTLNCIKMLYGSDKKITDVINKLSDLLEKSTIRVQGKFKMSMVPEDFMKMFGYGMLLVQALQNILPQKEELKEAELRLNSLQINLESNAKESDPELVKSPSVSRSDVDKDQEEMRPQFLKDPSFILDYLKKHFKVWETYEEDVEDHNDKIENHTDFKVVRTIGKNLNLLKIDRSKMISLSNKTIEDDSTNRIKDGPKIVRLLENNHLTKPVNTENIETSKKLIENNNNRTNDKENITDIEKTVPIKNHIENTNKVQNNKPKLTKELNYTAHENTFQEDSDKGGPKIVRNIKIIDEFEKKFKTREPLDLDLLDYSEIYEPSVKENPEFDIYSETNKNTDDITKSNHFEDNNYGLENTNLSTLADFYITPSISSDFENTATEDPNNQKKEDINSENVTSHYFKSVTEDNLNNTCIKTKSELNNCEVESETYTDIQEFENDTGIENNNSKSHVDNSESRVDNYESRVGNSETCVGDSESHIDNCQTANHDSGTQLDNSETHNDNLVKTAHIVQDDSTNDSGFENDSTYAHSMVKIFLNELSTTFQVLHSFVTKFVDEIRENKLSEKRKDVVHNQASKALEDMVAIIQQLKCWNLENQSIRLEDIKNFMKVKEYASQIWNPCYLKYIDRIENIQKSIIKRESAEDTVLKILLRNAGVEATTDKRMTRYRQIVIKCLEQAQILESALKIIVSTTIGDFDALSTNAETLNSSIRYFNIFE